MVTIKLNGPSLKTTPRTFPTPKMVFNQLISLGSCPIITTLPTTRLIPFLPPLATVAMKLGNRQLLAAIFTLLGQ